MIAGTADRVVDHGDQTMRLAEETPGARLSLVGGAGHMVHHVVPDEVARRVLAVSADAPDLGAPGLKASG